MILCIQNKPGTFTRQDPSPPLRFTFSRAPYSSSQLPIAARARTYVRTYERLAAFSQAVLRGRGKTAWALLLVVKTWEFVHVCTLSAYTLVISRNISVHDYECSEVVF